MTITIKSGLINLIKIRKLCTTVNEGTSLIKHGSLMIGLAFAN
jgi:hypothetical protein